MACRQIKVLYRLFDGLCHYCGDQTNRIQNHPKQATKDHVVPKGLGGSNTLDNYVLACQTCNNDKGTTLFYCMCVFCGPRIEAALEDAELVNNLFDQIISFNRAVVRKDNGVWKVHKGYSHHSYDTWEEAMAFVNTPPKVRRTNA